jgi:hypothetical protein
LYHIPTCSPKNRSSKLNRQLRDGLSTGTVDWVNAGEIPASSCFRGCDATVLRCRIDAASLSARRSALHDAHISGAGVAAPTEELEMVVERWSSEMDEAAAIAIAIAFKHSHTSQRPSQAVHTERTRPGRVRRGYPRPGRPI